MTQFGIVFEASPGVTAPLAKRVEALGFDIMLCPDTQNLAPDPYGQLSLAASATEKLLLGTGVTNPYTRHPAVTANTFASLQVESGGRAICGLGRGDSSAEHIGLRNATTKELANCAKSLRALLDGQGAELNRKSLSPLRWLSEKLPPVPIDIACTGPRTIRMAADIAERVSFAVGCAPERIDWALQVFNARLAETGRPRDEVQVGAYINLVCDQDAARARKLGKMIAGMIAHFAGMRHASTNHLPPQLKALADRMQNDYDMKHHAQETGSHLDMIDDEFIEWISICGPPQKCVDQLGALIDKGLQHIYLLGGASVAHPHSARQISTVDHSELFAKQVMPSLRERTR